MGKNKYNEVKLHKIPLEKFLAILTDLFGKGVEYIDILGICDDKEDYIGISVTRDYLSKEMRDKFDEYITDDDLLSKLRLQERDKPSDDNINDLI